MSPTPVRTEQVAAVRRFNRFYTRQIGLLEESHLHSPFSLTEVRVLYELAHRKTSTATDIGEFLALDHGYLSRLLRGFQKRGLVDRQKSSPDRRQTVLKLSTKGAKIFADLNSRADHSIRSLLQRLPEPARRTLVYSLDTAERLLDPQPESRVPFIVRPHRPGDMGWVVHRHGVLYQQEYGWNERFEALVAHIVADFIDNFDPKREHCWIAERDGEIVGSIFLVKKSANVAKLRLFLVEPSARGYGVGKALVKECIRFARDAGYSKIILWTQSCLDAARHIYEKAGFQLVEEKPHADFGYELRSQVWELSLSQARTSL